MTYIITNYQRTFVKGKKAYCGREREKERGRGKGEKNFSSIFAHNHMKNTLPWDNNFFEAIIISKLLSHSTTSFIPNS